MIRRRLVLALLFTILSLTCFWTISRFHAKRPKDEDNTDLRYVQLQYAAYHLQKPMDSFSRIIGAVRLFTGLMEDLHVDNPIKPDIQKSFIPQKLSFKQAIIRGLWGIDSIDVDAERVFYKLRSGFQVVTVVYDLNYESVIEMVEGLKKRTDREILVFAGNTISAINQRYLESRLRMDLVPLPSNQFGIDESGPLALLMADCRKCLYLHAESFLHDKFINELPSSRKVVFFKAPKKQNDTIIESLNKFEPSFKDPVPSVFKSVYIPDMTQHRLAILTAHALMRAKQYGSMPSNSWWLGLLMANKRVDSIDEWFELVGEPVLAGLPVQEELCGVLGSTLGNSDPPTLLYVEKILRHTRYLNITHMQPVNSYPSSACIRLDRKRIKLL